MNPYLIRWYQEAAISALFEYVRANPNGAPLIALPTGTGKAVILAEIIKRIFSWAPRTRVLIVTHVKTLVQQNANKLLDLWPLAPIGIYSAGLKQRDLGLPITFAGVQSIYKKAAIFGFIDILFIDEAHLLSPSSGTMYQILISVLKSINPNLIVIGLTATAYRMGQGMLTEGKDRIFTDICYDLTDLHGFNRLVAEGFLAPLYPKRTDAFLDVSKVGIDSDGEFKKGELEKAVDVDSKTRECLSELCYHGSDREHWMIFASGVHHAERIAELLRTEFNVSSAAVHSKNTDDENNKRVKAFELSEMRCIVNMNKLTTGYDFPPLDLIGMMRPSQSPGLWVQMCVDQETEILTRKGWAKRGNINVGDDIATFKLNDSSIEFKPATEVVDRPLQDWEELYSVKAPHIDLCVTGNHELISSTKRLNSAWRKREAQELAKLCEFVVPVCGLEKSSGTELTDAEIRFIGWYLSDGTYDKSNDVVSISQSLNSAYVDVIKDVLISANIKHTEYIHRRNNQYSDLVRYKVTKPNWIKYKPYLDKSYSAKEFEEFDKQDLEILLDSLYHGDGSKPNVNYEINTRRIIIGIDAASAGRLQSLCVRRDIRCNISTCMPAISDWNANPKLQYFISYNPNRNQTQLKKESKLTNIGYKKTNVWCVKTDNGTIITRRNGKVVIMGNCGRGTRPSPATGKRDCLALDFARNTVRLGPINDPIKPRGKGSGGGDAPVRICEKCGIYNPASARICFACGHEFTFAEKLLSAASTEELIRSDTPVIETFNVKKVMYTLYQKTSKNDDGIEVTKKPCMKVGYLCGMQVFYEWVFLDAPVQSFQAKKSRDWWRMRHQSEPPTPDTCAPCVSATHAALSISSQLKVPKAIRVWVNRPYPEVLSVEY